MKAPPFLVGCSLAFWGWRADFFVLSLCLAFFLEIGHWTRSKWQFTDLDYNRIWDLCAVGFVIGVIYQYSSDEITKAYAFTQWLPFFFYPIALAQVHGNAESLKLSTFSWWFRKKSNSAMSGKLINVSFFYFGICLVAASVNTDSSSFFYLFAFLLIAWALFQVRPQRFSLKLWVPVLILTGFAGYWGQVKIHEWQGVVESAMARWLANVQRRQTSPQESRTAIGQLGQLKLSGKIVLKVFPTKSGPPTYLREASYNLYRAGIWRADGKEFGGIPSDTNDIWILKKQPPGQRKTTLGLFLNSGRGILPLPNGAGTLMRLPVILLQTNTMGVTKVGDGPGYVHFDVLYREGEGIESTPDMGVDGPKGIPDHEAWAINRIAADLKLDSLAPQDRLRAIRAFFLDNFSYSTFTAPNLDKFGRESPLNRFLFESRSGHCEYFASATVLLLRRAGFPARYATGFAVQELARDKKTYNVRLRHAHAWCLVYYNNAWHDFDTTPAVWEKIEAEKASWMEPVRDLWSSVWFSFSKWRWGTTNFKMYIFVSLTILVVILSWRLIFRRHRRMVQEKAVKRPRQTSWPGLDSELFELERELEKRGWSRDASETFFQWKNRVQPSSGISNELLDPVLGLHYKYRFDPQGLENTERQVLRQKILELLQILGRERRGAR